MRLAKGKRITESDREEIEQFKGLLRDIADGKDQHTAYAERYGEVVYQSEEKTQ